MGITFFLGFSQSNFQISQKTGLDSISVDLVLSGESKEFIGNYQKQIKKIQSEKDSASQYKLTYNLAQGFLAQYSADHNPKLRLLEEKLSDYARVNFSSSYEAPAFSVLCLDSECGKLEYTPELAEIR